MFPFYYNKSGKKVARTLETVSGYIDEFIAGPTYTYTLDVGGVAVSPTGTVGRWVSKHGVLPSFLQATLANRPTLQVATGGYEVRFDGTNDIMSGDIGSTLSGTGFTIGIRVRVDNSAGQAWSYWTTNPPADGYIVYNGTASYDPTLRSARLEGVTPIPSLGVHDQIYISDGTGWNRYEDGVLALSAAAGFSKGTNWDIGGTSEAGNRYLNGAISRMVFFSGRLSSTDLAFVHTQLANTL